MKRQTPIQTQKETIPPQKRSLLLHAAVRTTPDHDMPSNGSAETRFGHDFSQVAVRPSVPEIGQDYSNASCLMFPQCCPFGGTCHTCSPQIQTKLKVGQPGDKYEQEADRVAESVMRMPESAVGRQDQDIRIQRACMECDDELRRQPIDEIDEEEREELIQAKLADGTQLQGQEAGSFTVPPIVHEVLRSPGQPLGPETRTFMESRFGHDFSRVRVHTDARAAESARAVNALAYTVGHKIAFGTGQYTPETTMGQRLLAHELTHMVQQREQPRSVTRNLSINQPNDVYEREADRIAGLVTRGQMVCRISPLGSKAQIQREFTACFETNVEEFRRSPMCTPPTRVVGPGQSAEEICGVYPGGSTDCEVDEETGEISGRVVVDVSETNPCVSPCVDLHERVHERQLRPLCAALRDCYQAADASQRPVSDCWRMGLPDPQRECEAYPVSVICLEERLAYAPECADAANFDYAWDVLEGEKCYLDHFCREAASIRSRRRSRIHSSGPDSGISR